MDTSEFCDFQPWPFNLDCVIINLMASFLFQEIKAARQSIARNSDLRAFDFLFLNRRAFNIVSLAKNESSKGL